LGHTLEIGQEALIYQNRKLPTSFEPSVTLTSKGGSLSKKRRMLILMQGMEILEGLIRRDCILAWLRIAL
jgi:hypothetical protein